MDTQRLLFCHYFLKTRDAEMAALMAGYRGLPPGEPVKWLMSARVAKLIDRLKEREGAGLDSFQAALRLAEIAFAPQADAAKLAFLPKDAGPEALEGLDLRGVSQVTRKGDGSVEVKLFDRTQALLGLMEFLSSRGEGAGSELMAALAGGGRPEDGGRADAAD